MYQKRQRTRQDIDVRIGCCFNEYGQAELKTKLETRFLALAVAVLKKVEWLIGDSGRETSS
jgi:hypothetical protein